MLVGGVHFVSIRCSRSADSWAWRRKPILLWQLDRKVEEQLICRKSLLKET